MHRINRSPTQLVPEFASCCVTARLGQVLAFADRRPGVRGAGDLLTWLPVLERLVAGLERMHDDRQRRAFLRKLGGDLAVVSAWVRKAGLHGKVDAARAPTFLHGGSSEGRWVVVGINPGADGQSGVAEETFKRKSADQYVSFHEDFFTRFPAFRRNGKQPWWSKLYRVSRVLDGIVARSVPVPWSDLQRSESFVVQDLLPFHGRTSTTLARRDFGRGPFLEISNATIAGIARSKARGVLVFSRMGYTMFRQHARITDVHDFKLEGSTRTRKMRAIDGYVACIGTVPLVALDNEIIAQPKFPYASLLPQLLDVLRVHKLVRATP
jgi:hypothetical protein